MLTSHQTTSIAKSRIAILALSICALVAISGCTTKTAFQTSFNEELLTPNELAIAHENPNVANNKAMQENANGNIANIIPLKTAEQQTPVSMDMSLQAVAFVALEQNPTISIARWQAVGAAAAVSLAKVKQRPKISYSLSSGPEGAYGAGVDELVTQIRSETSFTLSQLLYDFGKVSEEVNFAKTAKIAAQKRLAHKISKVLFDVSDIYLKVLEQDLLIANSYENEKAHKETYRLVSINERGGNATQADVQKAFTRLEGARTQTLDMLSKRQQSASEFRRLTGLEPENLSKPKTNNNIAEIKASEIEKYSDRNPFMQAILIDIESLKHQKTALERSYMPTLSLEGAGGTKHNVGAESPLSADARIQLALRGVIFDGGSIKAKIAQTEAKLGEKTARYRKAQYDIENQVNDVIRILSTAKDKQKSIRKRIKASKDVVRLYTEQFKAGERTIFELLDAQQELFAAKAEQISNRYDVLRAQYSAQKLTGELIPNLLGGLE